MKGVRGFILCLLLLSSSVWAAGQGLDHSVRGKVTDAVSGKALEAVAVSIPGSHIATVTNADGEYIIKSSVPIGELEFSYLGYRTEKRRVSESSSRADVRLFSEAIPLEEALVIVGNPWEIMRAAERQIRENFPTEPELLECFYRETIRKRSRYTQICEAVARLYKSSYTRNVYGDRAALEKSRVLLSQKRSDTLSIMVMGGPTQALMLDAVKNPDIFLDPETLRLYRLDMDQTAYIDGRPQFVIKLSPGAMSEFPLYFGTVYIDRETLAFSRIELSLDVSDKGAATRMMLVRKPRGLRFTPKELSLTASYRSVEGKSRLAYLRTNFRFNCDWKKRLFSTPYTVVNELVVTDKRPEAKPIARAEMFSTRDYLTEKSASFLDPDFWKAYNIIEPSESLEHAIGRLKKH